MKIRLSIEVLFACCVLLALISGVAADQDPHRTLKQKKDYNKLGWGDGNQERTKEEMEKNGKIEDSYADKYKSEIEEDEEEPYEIDLVEELRGVEDWFSQETQTIKDNLEGIYAKFTNELSKQQPELQEQLRNWTKEHWDEQWEEDLGTRWDAMNMQMGWDMEDIQAEFEEFFANETTSAYNAMENYDSEKL